MLNYLVRATIIDVFMFPPTALVAGVSAAVAMSFRLRDRSQFRNRELLLCIPIVFIVALIIHGTVFSHQDSVAALTTWESRAIRGILLAHFVSCVVIVWVMKGMRVYAASALLFLTCFVMMAAFEAQMSVTNRWL